MPIVQATQCVALLVSDIYLWISVTSFYGSSSTLRQVDIWIDSNMESEDGLSKPLTG